MLGISSPRKPVDPIENLRIATPCHAVWEAMSGDERVRHCSLCSLNVYNFGEMTRDEVRALLLDTEGRICARLYQRSDGTVLTSDCPSGLRALRQRMSRLVTAVVAAVVSVSAFAGNSTTGETRLKKHGKVRLEVKRATTRQQAVFAGLVVDEAGAPLPGVTVIVRDETAQRKTSIVTDMNGAFTLAFLSDSLYHVEVTLSGFKSAVIEHLLLKQDEVTRARVALRVDSSITVTVGVLTVEPTNEPLSTTFQQTLINKLPIAH